MSTSDRTGREEQFLDKLRQIVLDNLSNEQFGVEELAQSYGMSRSQLHRKLKKLRKQSISQFVREIRLEEALKLLKQDAGSVSEIAYKVGFNSPTYFNTTFRNYFGYPPGEVRLRTETSSQKRTEPITSPQLRTSKGLYRYKSLLYLLGIAVVILTSVGSYFILKSDNNPKQDASLPLQGDLASPTEKSIAVLPFEDNSSEMDQAAFANAIMIEVINHLVQLKDLKVTSRASSSGYSGTNRPTKEIAKELGVSHILLGSVQKEQGQVRITVQLVDGDQDRSLWSETYDGNLNNVLDMQSTIAQQVADELLIQIGPDVKTHISKVPTKNIDAYSKYLEALGNFGDTDKNLQLYSDAIELDPEFAEAYTGLATEKLFAAYISKIDIDNVDQYIGEIKNLLFKALKLDPNNARAYDLLGSTVLRFDWDFEKAEYYLTKAQELNPSSADSEYVLYLIAIGRFEEALNYNTFGVIPFKPNLSGVWLDQGRCYVYLKNPEKTRESIQIAMGKEDVTPGWHPGLLNLLCYLQDYEELIANFEAMTNREEVLPQQLSMAAVAYWHTGQQEKAKDILAEIRLMNQNPRINSPDYFMAIIYAQSGEYDLAFTSLNRAFQNREMHLHWLKVEFLLEPLRNDPRYVEPCKKIGIELDT